MNCLQRRGDVKIYRNLNTITFCMELFRYVIGRYQEEYKHDHAVGVFILNSIIVSIYFLV